MTQTEANGRGAARPTPRRDGATAETHDQLEVLAAVANWAFPHLSGDAPVFGSPEWLDLPLSDTRRSAAVARAALAWWRCGEPIEDAEARTEAAVLKQASVGISSTADWADLSRRPTHAELQRRRDWSAQASSVPITVADALASWDDAA